jgi:hypothetical protein
MIEQLPYFHKHLADELTSLAIKHHAQDILDDMSVMNESELMGSLNYLRRIDADSDHSGS